MRGIKTVSVFVCILAVFIILCGNVYAAPENLVRGWAYLGTGAPIVGAKVKVLSTKRKILGRARTTASGSFMLHVEDLPAQYVIKVKGGRIDSGGKHFKGSLLARVERLSVNTMHGITHLSPFSTLTQMLGSTIIDPETGDRVYLTLAEAEAMVKQAADIADNRSHRHFQHTLQDFDGEALYNLLSENRGGFDRGMAALAKMIKRGSEIELPAAQTEQSEIELPAAAAEQSAVRMAALEGDIIQPLAQRMLSSFGSGIISGAGGFVFNQFLSMAGLGETAQLNSIETDLENITQELLNIQAELTSIETDLSDIESMILNSEYTTLIQENSLSVLRDTIMGSDGSEGLLERLTHLASTANETGAQDAAIHIFSHLTDLFAVSYNRDLAENRVSSQLGTDETPRGVLRYAQESYMINFNMLTKTESDAILNLVDYWQTFQSAYAGLYGQWTYYCLQQNNCTPPLDDADTIFHNAQATLDHQRSNTNIVKTAIPDGVAVDVKSGTAYYLPYPGTVYETVGAVDWVGGWTNGGRLSWGGLDGVSWMLPYMVDITGVRTSVAGKQTVIDWMMGKYGSVTHSDPNDSRQIWGDPRVLLNPNDTAPDGGPCYQSTWDYSSNFETYHYWYRMCHTVQIISTTKAQFAWQVDPRAYLDPVNLHRDVTCREWNPDVSPWGDPTYPGDFCLDWGNFASVVGVIHAGDSGGRYVFTAGQ